MVHHYSQKPVIAPLERYRTVTMGSVIAVGPKAATVVPILTGHCRCGIWETMSFALDNV